MAAEDESSRPHQQALAPRREVQLSRGKPPTVTDFLAKFGESVDDARALIGRDKPIGYPKQFNPKQEIQNAFQVGVELRPIAVTEFKQNLAYQKEGVAVMQTYLIEKITKNPEISYVELMLAAGVFRGVLGLTDEQFDLLRHTIDRYIVRHDELISIMKRYEIEKDPMKTMFRDFFGTFPKGIIEVTIGPVAFNFYCHNEADFITAASYDDYHQGFLPAKLSDHERLSLNRSFGIFIPYAPISEGRLTNAIILIKMSANTDEPSIQKTVIHEEEHAAREFLQTVFIGYYARKTTSSKNVYPTVEKDLDTPKRRLIVVKKINSELADSRRIAEDEVKSEIQAFFKEGESADRILTILRTRENGYDFFSKYWRRAIVRDYVNLFGARFKPDITKAISDMEIKYRSHILQSLHALKTLVQHGFSRDKAVNFLSEAPLDKWEKEVRRLLEARNQAE